MGVLNVTPDSFSDGGELYRESAVDLDRVLERAKGMREAGAAVLDIGGESTRPGAEPVTVEEELRRVIPVIDALRELDLIISVDTRHASVAQAAIEAGVHMVNDVSAGSDEGIRRRVADSGVGYALMHMQGQPQTMQTAPSYTNVVAEVRGFLQDRVARCLQSGIEKDRLLIDPGFGFGKTVEHNLKLLAGLSAVRFDELPLLVGLSRKTTIGAVTGRALEDRVYGSVAAALIAAQNGANLIRVHDVAATADALQIWRAVREHPFDSQTKGIEG